MVLDAQSRTAADKLRLAARPPRAASAAAIMIQAPEKIETDQERKRRERSEWVKRGWAKRRAMGDKHGDPSTAQE
jgi:hypothetical protein